MHRRVALALVTTAAIGASALALSGCGDRRRLPKACTDGPRAVAVALRQAPRAVALYDGTRLSACVSRARYQGELQGVGLSLNSAGAALARGVPHSDAAALQLGYLIGAVRRGAGESNGLAGELAHRIAQYGARPPPARRSALARGISLGAAAG